MKKFITIVTTIIISSNSLAQAPAIEWQKSLGGSNEESAKSIKQTADGGYIIAGSTKSTDNAIATHLDADNNPTFDYWIVKTNATGTITWQKAYGGSNNDFATAVIQTTDGGYLVGGETNSPDGDVTGNTFNAVNGHSWLIKIDSQGVLQWQKFIPIGQIGSSIKSIVETATGSYIITGNCYATLGTFSYGDIFIVEVSSTGGYNPNDVILKGGGYHDYVNSISKTTNGGYILAGATYSNDGDFSVNHSSYIGYGDIWIIKLNGTLQQEWQKLIGGSYTEEAFGAEQTADGGYIVGGYTGSNDDDVSGNQGATDFWLVKLDSSGTIQWQKTYGGTLNDYCYGFKKSTDGSFFLTGYSGSTDGDLTANYGTKDFWVVKTDNSGVIQWQKNLGGSGYETAYTIDVTIDNGVIVAGDSFSNDNDVTNNYGNYDYWIVKLAPNSLNTNNMSKNSILIYPNPSSSIINIDLPNQASITKIEITDMLGKKVLENEENLNQINIEKLSFGTYLIKITADNNCYQSKIIKE